MTRLRTWGFETGDRLDDRSAQRDPNANAGTVRSQLTQAIVRSGEYAGHSNSLSSVGAGWIMDTGALAASRTYFYRTWCQFDAFPLTAQPRIIDIANLELRVTSAGAWRLANNGTQIGTDQGTVPLNQWFKLEIRVVLNGSSVITDVEVRVDDAVIFNVSGQSITSTGSANFQFGYLDAASTTASERNIYFDDGALNDDQGATHNSWCGDGKVVQLDPVADVSIDSWTAGGGGTSNLWEALNNKPPVGLAPGSATNTSQVKNADTTLPSELRVELESYEDAGLSPVDEVVWVELYAFTGESVATGTKQGTLELLNDPVLAVNITNYGVVTGTHDTGWTTQAVAGTTPPGDNANAPVAMLSYDSFSGTTGVECEKIALTVEYLEIPIVDAFAPQVISYLG